MVKPNRPAEPHCPARLARFRIELGADNPQSEPNTPLPCIESVERPGACTHCRQPMLRGAGAPHGPFCTTIDRGCRECLRLKAESEPRPPLRFGLPQAPRPLPEIEPLSTQDIQRLHKEATERLSFPGELDDRSRDETARDAALTTLRLIAEIKRLQTMADDAIGELGSFEARAAELSRRVDSLATSLSELRTVVLGGRKPFSSTPVVIDAPELEYSFEGLAACPKRSGALPCKKNPGGDSCIYCGALT